MKYTRDITVKAAGFGISALFLYLTFKDTDIAVVGENLSVVTWYQVALAVVIDIAFFVIRGAYQKTNLRYIQPDLRIGVSIAAVANAQFYNIIFPARMGELVRMFFLSRYAGISKAAMAPYIVIEKLLDLTVIACLGTLIVMSGLTGGEMGVTIGWLAIVVALAGFGILMFVRFNRPLIDMVVKIAPSRFHDRLNTLNGRCMEGIRFYRTWAQFVKSIVLLFVGWSAIMGIIAVLSYPYVVESALPWYSFLYFTVFSVLALSLPSAPSGVGVMHYGLFLAVKLLAGERFPEMINGAVAFVVVLHFVFTVIDFCMSGAIMVVFAAYKRKTGRSAAMFPREGGE